MTPFESAWLVSQNTNTDETGAFPSHEGVGWDLLTEDGENCKGGPVKGETRKVHC